MKKAIVMVSLYLFPRLLVAQDFDVRSLVGEDWYGLYLNGQKAGYAVESVSVDEKGQASIREEAQFRIEMAGLKQSMQFVVNRVYAADGSLLRIDQDVEDNAGLKQFKVQVQGNEMTLTTSIGGANTQTKMPKPKESLQDAVKQLRLVGEAAKVGDSVSFSIFEPMYGQEIDGTARVDAVEERVLDGVATKVFKIQSLLPAMGITSVAYVAGDGTTLEDTIAGIIKKRLEPKEMAQNVEYVNDVIVSNAAYVDKPIENARSRESLSLRITGPLTPDHLFNEPRQELAAKDGYVLFTGKKISLEGYKTTSLPVTDESMKPWLAPTVMVQCDNPKLIEKAKEIAGDEKDSFAASTKLCHWVHSNVRTTYSAQLTNALEVLENPEGDCTEHSILFIGLARALGLPAREIAGLIYVNDSKPGFYFHQWASVWIGRWVDVDPTFDQPLADVTHIKLAEGDLFAQAKLIPAIGQLRVEVVDDAAGGDAAQVEGR